MPFWFAHLHFGELVRSRLDEPLSARAFAWGSLCPDVDKVSEVPRSTSHFGRGPLAFAPEDFPREAGLDGDQAAGHRAFLAGYLAHLLLDDAWYRQVWSLRQRDPALDSGWSSRTTRALTLALDLAVRPRLDAGLLELLGGAPAPPGLELLPFARRFPSAVPAVLRAARTYLGWDGSLQPPPQPPLRGWVEGLRVLQRQEAPLVERALGVLDLERLGAELVEEVRGGVERLLAALGDAEP